MDIMEEMLPINLDDWEVVQRTHTLTYPYNRSVMTLQRVFNDLARVTEPTGDPNIPPAVKKAKVLRHKLREKTEGTTGSPEAEDMVLGIDNEEEDEDEEAEDDASEYKNEGEANKEEDGDDIVEYPPSVIRTGTVNQRPSPTGGGSISSSLPAAKPTKKKASSRSTTTKRSQFPLNRTSGAIAFPSVSPKFTTQLMSMKTPTTTTGKKGHSDDGGFSFQNMMGMMMMQQQQERESIREDRFFQAEQMKMEREERAEQARQDRAQQQQMMTMMMMAMMGGGK